MEILLLLFFLLSKKISRDEIIELFASSLFIEQRNMTMFINVTLHEKQILFIHHPNTFIPFDPLLVIGIVFKELHLLIYKVVNCHLFIYDTSLIKEGITTYFYVNSENIDNIYFHSNNLFLKSKTLIILIYHCTIK